MFISEDGTIVFINMDQNSKRYGQESLNQRMKLDETTQIRDVQRKKDKNGLIKQERFNLRIQNVSTFFECDLNEGWLDTFRNFNFKT